MDTPFVTHYIYDYDTKEYAFWVEGHRDEGLVEEVPARIIDSGRIEDIDPQGPVNVNLNYNGNRARMRFSKTLANAFRMIMNEEHAHPRYAYALLNHATHAFEGFKLSPHRPAAL